MKMTRNLSHSGFISLSENEMHLTNGGSNLLLQLILIGGFGWWRTVRTL